MQYTDMMGNGSFLDPQERHLETRKQKALMAIIAMYIEENVELTRKIVELQLKYDDLDRSFRPIVNQAITETRLWFLVKKFFKRKK